MRGCPIILALIALAAILVPAFVGAQSAGDLLEQCQALYRDGDFQGAVEACGRALEKDPRMDAALNSRGWSRWKLKAYDQALADFDAAIRLNAKNAKAHLGRSNVLYNLKRYDESKKAADSAIQLDPKYSAAYVARGLARMELGDLASAEKDCQKALELNPKNTTALTNLGYLRRKAGDIQGAIGYYDRAIAANPEAIDAHLNRGAARNMLGDTAGAIADASKVIELDPKDADAWANRGSANLKKGDYASARRDLEKALALKPGHANAAAKLKELGARGTGKGTVPAARKRIIFGDFSLEVVEGWERAPSKVEQEEKRWSFADLASLSRGSDAAPLMAAFSFESTSYDSGEARDAILERYSATVKKAHPQGFTEKADLLAGLPARRFRFLSADGTAAFFYAVDAGEKIHFVQVYAQDAGENPPKRARELLSTLLIEGAASVTAAATPPSQAPPAATRNGWPTPTFSATDPCAAAKAAPARGMPWNGAVTIAPPTAAPPPTDLVKLSRTQYNGSVSMAMEGMRLLYGPMDPGDERAFEAAWVPLFDNPTTDILDYLDRLTPLLAEFLAGREAWTAAASALEAAFLDGSLAVAADAKDAWADAMARVEQQTRAMTILEEKMAGSARALEALGNPPNPLAAKCAAAEQYHRSLGTTGPPTGEGTPGLWTGLFECTSCPPCDEEAIRARYAPLEERIGLPAGTVGNVMAELKCGPQPFALVWRPRVPSYNSDKYIQYTVKGQYFGVRNDDWAVLDPEAAEASTLIQDYYFPGGYNDSPEKGTIKLRPVVQDAPLGWKPEGAATLRHAVAAIEEYKERDPKNAYPWLRRTNYDMDVQNFLDTAAKIDKYTQERERFIEAGRIFLRLPDAKLNSQGGNFAVFMGLYDAAVPDTQAPPPPQPVDTQALQDTIDFHESMIDILKRNLAREQADLERESDLDRYRRMTAKEQEQVNNRRKELALRIVGIQSDIQAEQDLIASVRTGTLVHTRSAFDEFAHQKLVSTMKEEAWRSDRVRRIAAHAERQIELLPADQRKSAREQVHRILDPKVFATGDVEKARRLAEAVDNQVQGHWAGVSAREEEKAIAAEQSEFYAQMAIMASSACVVGFGSQAAVEAFGEEAFFARWAPNFIGGVYGGTTGFIAGGLSPTEGIKGALSNVHTIGGIGVNFYDGYAEASQKKGTSRMDASWEGFKKAGFNLLLEKGFEIGAKFLVGGSLLTFGKDSGLFKPVKVGYTQQRDLGRSMRMTKDLLAAQDEIHEFQAAQKRLFDAHARNAAPAEVAQLEAETKKLAAALNSSFHAKWLIKYKFKDDAGLVRAFNGRVQESYDEMTPQMLKLLKDQGYDVGDLQFKPLRNASSGDSASMDLDLALVEHPGQVITRNGKKVEIAEFQKDAQKAMNDAYHKVTGYSAARSELNLTTSEHKEAYKNLALLGEKVDFTAIPSEDLAQIGAVLDVKLGKIQGDAMLSPIAKVQASCRESTKEIKNMLLPMLKQKLAKAPARSPTARQLEKDIAYWEGMLGHFTEIGTQSTDPMRILELDRLIRRDTGGNNTMGVVHDLTLAFAGR